MATHPESAAVQLHSPRRGIRDGGRPAGATGSITALVPAPRRSPEAVLRRRGRLLRLPVALLAVDGVALGVAALLVEEVSLRVLAVAAVTLMLCADGGMYRSRLTPSVLDDLPALAARAAVAGAVITTVGVFEDGNAGRTAVLFSAAVLGLVIAGRSLVYDGVRRARRSGRIAYQTLVVGCGELAGQLAQGLLDHPEVGLRPIGFLDDDPLLPEARRPVPHVGRVSDLVDVISRRDVSHVVMAFGSAPESGLVDLLRSCDRLACEIYFVPRLYEVHAMSRDMEIVWGFPLIRMRRAAFRSPSWRVKRLMDVLVAAVALVLLSPLMAGCAVAVRLKIGSPVLFRQQRVGLDGRPFELLKFCSLRPNDTTESAQRWTVAQDQRLGGLGRLLRRTSFDELPQLWNILRGEMSLVGPRPERPYFVEEFRRQFPRYMARHRVPSGLTGAAQVAGLRGDTSIPDRARFDNAYIENWSLWLDVKILLRTIGQVVLVKGG